MSKPTNAADNAALEICHEIGIPLHHRERIAQIVDEQTKLPDMIDALRGVTIGSTTMKLGVALAVKTLNHVDA